jgi:hypothetical protein
LIVACRFGTAIYPENECQLIEYLNAWGKWEEESEEREKEGKGKAGEINPGA